MSDQKILKGLHSVTSSPESVDGREHCSSQDGVQTDLFGLEALPVSHFPQPGKEKEKTTSDISGQSSLISSASASLQQSLESKLRQLSDMGGSTIYKLTLKRKDTPQGRSYFQLAASALRTKESASSSWQTPTTSDTNGVRKPDGKRGLGLNTQAQSAWPTPVASDNGERGTFDSGSVRRRMEKGKTIDLSMMVHSAWPTPAARDVKGVSGSGRQEKKGNPSDTVPNAAATVPWATPTATDPNRGTKPPRPQDTGIPLTQQVSGLTQEKSIAETGNIAPSQLNPRFSLWLMGYPIEWAYCAERVTPLSRKRQRKS